MNAQRKAFGDKVKEHMQSNRDRDMEHAGMERKMNETRIEHHDDGTHTVHHGDGDKSGPHPSMAHAAMAMMAKHHGGEHGHIMPGHDGGATTHHVTMDGTVEGPHEHGSEDEAYNHLRSSIGENGGMEADPMANMGGGTEDDSSFE